MTAFDTVYFYAIATWPFAAAILFISICRLTSMDGMTLQRVKFEYAVYNCIAVVIVLGPLVGDWPGAVDVTVMAGLVLILLFQAHAWRHNGKDTPPAEAQSDHMPLTTLPPEPYR